MTTIALADYDIHVGDIWNTFQSFLTKQQYTHHIVIVDENTRRDCLPIFVKKSGLSDLVIVETKSGEINKNISTCEAIWQQMMDAKAGRQSVAILLGGGVIGDMGGFCGATFKRGMDFIQIPTTLLSQVDSSIGGKLGIDFGPIKNSVGLFKNPKAVFIDPTFYKTLPREQLRSGFAEMIKHSLIADVEQWKALSALDNLDNFDWQKYLIPSLLIKKKIVEEDPFEKGIRKALNFGHTIGHAVEGYALHSEQPLLHGESIAIGMICEAWLSCQVTGLAESEMKRITQYIIHHYGKYHFPKSIYPQLLQLMQQDKKNETKEINFTMLKTPGKALINQFCSNDLIKESLDYYLAC